MCWSFDLGVLEEGDISNMQERGHQRPRWIILVLMVATFNHGLWYKWGSNAAETRRCLIGIPFINPSFPLCVFSIGDKGLLCALRYVAYRHHLRLILMPSISFHEAFQLMSFVWVWSLRTHQSITPKLCLHMILFQWTNMKLTSIYMFKLSLKPPVPLLFKRVLKKLYECCRKQTGADLPSLASPGSHTRGCLRRMEHVIVWEEEKGVFALVSCICLA